jgi:tetratricopeptide (TPR) repeat protein
MDRRDFAVCAGIIASLVAVLGVVFGTQSRNLVATKRIPPLAGASAAPANGPSPGKPVRNAPLLSAVAVAEEGETRVDSLVVPVVALAEEGATASSGKIIASAPTGVDASGKTQIKFTGSGVQQNSSRSSKLPLVVADSRSLGESEFKFAMSESGSQVATPPTQKRLVLAYDVSEESHASADDKPSQHKSSSHGTAPSNARKNDLRSRDVVTRVIPKRETPKQDVARSNHPLNRDVSSHDRSAEADKAPVADSRAKSEFKFVTKGTIPQLPSPAEQKTTGPAFSVPADLNAATDNKVSGRNSPEPTIADHDLQKDGLHTPGPAGSVAPNCETPQQNASKNDPPKRDALDQNPTATADKQPTPATGGEREAKSATGGAEPDSANALAKRDSVPVKDVPADGGASTNGIATRVVPKRKTAANHDVSKQNPAKLALADRAQTAASDTPPTAATGAEREAKSATGGGEPDSANALAKKEPAPVKDVRAKGGVSATGKVSQRSASVQKVPASKPDVVKRAAPKREIADRAQPVASGAASAAAGKAESEIKSAARDVEPKAADAPTPKVAVPAKKVLAEGDAPDNGKALQRDSAKTKIPARKTEVATPVVPKRETANQGVPKQNPPKREIADRSQLAASGTPTVAPAEAEIAIKSAARPIEPESAPTLAIKNVEPANDIPADVAADQEVLDRDSADQATAAREPSRDNVREREPLTRVLAKRESAQQNVLKRRSPDRDFSDHDPSATPDAPPIVGDPAKPADSRSGRTKLPWAEAVPNSPEMITAADQRVRQGFQLADQGALYLARAEFIAALKLIAQANDVRQGTRWHSKAVTAGFLALKESTEFVIQNTGIEDADVAKIISGHKTPILKRVDVSEMTPMAAAQRYYTYAQEQLAGAAAQEKSGSMALYGLGKAAIAAAGNKSPDLEYTGQARALYRAALMAEGRNYLAANELGVLLTENGQPELAREMLMRSISLSPQAATWENLAAVHARLGQRELAEKARQQAMSMRQSGRGVAGPAVQWVDPATFARMIPSTGDLAPPATPAKMEPAPAKVTSDSAQPTENVAKKGAAGWLPWSFRR